VSYTVVFTPEARDDLVDLYDYIANHGNPARALRYIERIEKICMSLQALPERGSRRDDLRPGLRVMGFEHRALIAFHVTTGCVAILRILYGGRSIERAFPQSST
jgi:toxin ParE1/3/4